jgi:hypothetical protein
MINSILSVVKQDEPMTWKHWLGLNALFAILLLVLFREFIFDATQILVAHDQLQSLGTRALRQGGVLLPMWNPHYLGGVPTYDALFGDALHPLVLLESLLGPERGVGYKFIACVQIAFATALPLFSLLSRSWKIGGLVAFLFALNPQFFTHIFPGHDGKMMVIAMLPLALYGLFMITRHGRSLGAFWMALAIALMILSSQLQTTYYVLWGLLGLSIYENFVRNSALAFKVNAIKQSLIGVAVVIALAIGSIQILPPLEYTSHESVRSTAEKKTLAHASSWSIHPEELASMVLPEFITKLPDNPGPLEPQQNYWGINSLKFNHDTPGMLLLVLGLLALAAPNRRGDQLALVWLASLPIVYALGMHTPWFEFLVAVLPKAEMFRAPSMVLFWVPIALALLASQWLGDLKRGEAGISKVGLIVVAGIFITLALLRGMWNELPSVVWVVAILLTVFAILGRLGLELQGSSVSFKSLTDGIKICWQQKKTWFFGFSMPLLLLLPLGSSEAMVKIIEATRPLDLELMKSTSGAVWLSVLFGAMILGSVIYLKRAPTLNLALIVLTVIGWIELWSTNHRFVAVLPHDTQFTSAAELQAEQIRKISGLEYRVLNFDQILQDNYGPYYGLRFVLGFHDNEPAKFRALRSGDDSESRMGNLFWAPTRPQLFQSMISLGVDSVQAAQLLGDPMQMLVGAILQANPGSTPEMIQKYLQQQTPDQISSMLQQIESNGGGAQQRTFTAMKLGLHPYANLLGIKAIVLPGQVLQNPNAWGRFSLFANYQVMDDKSAQMASARGLNAEVVPVLSSPSFNANAQSQRQDLRYEVIAPDQYRVHVESPIPGIVVFNENDMPGWEAVLNGQELKRQRAFGAFFAFEVPAGKHSIDVSYHSSTMNSSLMVSILGFSMLILLMLISLVFDARRLQKRREHVI